MQKHPLTSSLLPQNSTYIPSASSSVFDLPIQNLYPPEQNRISAPATSGIRNASVIVVSGGTGCNSLCPAFGQDACYVLPVSDDGGSSSEIIRVIGSLILALICGPSIGDIRSRLIRLIPQAPPNSPLDAIRTLLSYRFSVSVSEHEARDEWRSIVEGKSPLWKGIPPDKKEAIRGFLVHFESEVLKRAHKNFSFRNGSVGNYLLAAAQGQANILPVLVTNHTVTIAVELEDLSTLVGQCNISHPVEPAASVTRTTFADIDAIDGDQLLKLEPHNSDFQKSSEDNTEGYSPLPARIARLFYINPYGHEIHPSPNPEFLSQLEKRDVLVYSCGSLWTSIIPCLALRGVASAIARSRSLKAKVLLLNTENDRETDGFTALDYIRAIVNMLNRADVPPHDTQSRDSAEHYPSSAFVTHLVYLKGSMVTIDVKEIHVGVECIEVDAGNLDEGHAKFDAASVQGALARILQEVDAEV